MSSLVKKNTHKQTAKLSDKKITNSNQKLAHDKDDGRERLRLWLKLLRTSHYIEQNIRENMRSHFQTTLPRFDVLATLSRAGKPLRMSEISQKLLVSNGNTTPIVKRLEEEGLLKRVQEHHDKRAFYVSMTEAGRKQFTKMARAHLEWVDELLQPINDKDSKEIVKLLSPIKI